MKGENGWFGMVLDSLGCLEQQVWKVITCNIHLVTTFYFPSMQQFNRQDDVRDDRFIEYNYGFFEQQLGPPKQNHIQLKKEEM